MPTRRSKSFRGGKASCPLTSGDDLNSTNEGDAMKIVSKRALQALVASATVAAGIGLVPTAAQADVDCAAPPPEGTLYYHCEHTDTGNKTVMGTLATSDGGYVNVIDHALSWNRLKNWDLCSKILFYSAINVKIGESDPHCYHMTKRDEKTESWSEQLTPYEAANIAYIEIEHWKH
ncbi:MAG: hypothetical protein LC777_11850 [Actinobacteria bacterium]|nr:hypothetical protein [Actinomycetota bacterium]